jgi:hypothetical protein
MLITNHENAFCDGGHAGVAVAVVEVQGLRPGLRQSAAAGDLQNE